MKIELGIGDSVQILEVDDKNVLAVLHPGIEEKQEKSESEILEAAMQVPIGTPILEEIIKPNEKIAILTSDITRPMPSKRVLPVLLQHLYRAGVKNEDITIIFARGNHRLHTEEEKRRIVGDEIFNKIACEDSCTGGMVSLGKTLHGTPIDIDKRVAEADRRICLGNIEYHYFAGYSGGAKAIMPGMSTKEAIQSNHSQMVLPNACAGNLTENPVRDDLEEAALKVGCDFLLNVILDENKRIVRAVAGDLIQAHRRGCEMLDHMYLVPIQEKADIVITSQGGLPKDISLYQTQKALDNAKYAVKDGGTIILIGSCKEGMGEKVFEDWMLQAEKPEDLVERIQKEFVLGGHKAAAIALVMRKAEVYLVSEIEPELVKKIFFTPFSHVQKAYECALKKYGENAKVLIMPYGGSTLPEVTK